MDTAPVLSISNPLDGSFGFRMLPFEGDGNFNELQRVNYFSIIWIFEGTAELKADFSEYTVSAGTMMFFCPYQPFMITASGDSNDGIVTDCSALKGVMLNFHPDFFCIIKHQKEVACNGILFNNLYSPPFVVIAEDDASSFHLLMNQIKKEVQFSGLAQYDLLVSYLKILLINATRIKSSQIEEFAEPVDKGNEPFILQGLKDAIDKHFKNKHSAGEYADLLNISVKALGKIVKDHFHTTLTFLIAERIVLEAKKELYLTNKPVKEIAYEMGFDDEYHFSRYFKNKVKVSPQVFRNSLKNAWGEVTASTS